MQTPNLDSQLSEAALAERDLHDISLNAAQLHGPAIGEVVHGSLGDVEAIRGVVNCQNVDRPALECRLPACAAVGRVPAANGLSTADVWEALDIALDVPEQPC